MYFHGENDNVCRVKIQYNVNVMLIVKEKK